jgi:hypothetical protein
MRRTVVQVSRIELLRGLLFGQVWLEDRGQLFSQRVGWVQTGQARKQSLERRWLVVFQIFRPLAAVATSPL